MEQLHPGAKWIFRFRGWFGGIFILVFLSFFMAGFLAPLFNLAFNGATMFMMLAIIYIAAVLIIGEVYARMSYTRWLYEFTSDNLKIERGIIWKKYSNIPYERVQNVDITRGILARMLGYSTVNIQTAGYSYTGKGMPTSEGYIPAIDMAKAEQIRDFLMKKISKQGRSQGL